MIEKTWNVQYRVWNNVTGWTTKKSRFKACDEQQVREKLYAKMGYNNRNYEILSIAA